MSSIELVDDEEQTMAIDYFNFVKIKDIYDIE
jgi:hypothetical protein